MPEIGKEEKIMPPRKEPPRAWQRMLSGRRLDLLDPSPLDVEIEDIAHGLARVARWNGQTRGPHIFSVAQHSVLVEHIAGHLDTNISAKTRAMVLLHDAPEYVIGDIISPFKTVIGETYKDVEARLMAAIHLRFALPAKPASLVHKVTKAADRAAAFIEATHLAGFTFEEADKFFGRPDMSLRDIDHWLAPISSQQAEEIFLTRFRALEAEFVDEA
jgi:5'-deoxynucleotidase YfbR-like HD superfamily hydrolase